ncbi:hypothetical protein O7635_09110 [Asanoa sp. WMMD1127]|uniref:hypothetical protein n=1 Tax=Asanoa sp. WMMD1127 TaxID=3016107 RepID=UPI002417C0A3|nr:hypothetical protein [Asanoa sp. WMMD1127]MDG4822012.1 hypothetical protein [Asanoa sp. WMMD1127]
MSVTWAATSPETGRFDGSERTTTTAALEGRFNALRSRGAGYLEVRLPGSEYPQLTLGFEGDRAVIHLFRDVEQVLLLAGDGSARADEVIEVPAMDEIAPFTGDYVRRTGSAWDRLRALLHKGSPSQLGDWVEL